MTKQEFLNARTEIDYDWAAKELLQNYSDKELNKLQRDFKKMFYILYKSWARDMSLNDMKKIFERISKL